MLAGFVSFSSPYVWASAAVLLVLFVAFLFFNDFADLYERLRHGRKRLTIAEMLNASRPKVAHGYSYIETIERRNALRRGMSLEEYRAEFEKKHTEKIAKMLGVTTEEAVAQGFHKMPLFMISYELMARRRSAELGRTVTREECLEEDRERMNKPPRPMSDEEYECTTSGVHASLIWEYVETGTLADRWKLEHLKNCSLCLASVSRAKEDYAKAPGPDCFTSEELAAVLETGMIGNARSAHKSGCQRCYIHFDRARAKHLASPDGPECLTQEEMHHLHLTGELSPKRRGHTEKCERCRQRFDRLYETYLDTILPYPGLTANVHDQ